MSPDFDLSDCQKLDFSPALRQQRLVQFLSRFEAPALKRLLCVGLFLLGAKRSRIAQVLDLPADTARSVIKTVLRDGLPALEDRRRRGRQAAGGAGRATGSPAVQSTPLAFCLHSGEEGLRVDFGAGPDLDVPAGSLVLPPSRPLQTKVVLLSFLDAGWLEAEAVGKALGYSTSHVRSLAAKMEAHDAGALVDQRQGQKQDYRVDERLKAQIIEQFLLEMAREGKVSARTLTERLEQQCQVSLPQRTVGHHMQKLGLSGIKKSLHDSLRALKKTPEPDLGRGGKDRGGKRA